MALTLDQLSPWPKSHAYCLLAHGVARPGKTKRDHELKAWRPKHVRRAAQIARQAEIKSPSKRGRL